MHNFGWQINARQQNFVAEMIELAASNLSSDRSQWERLAQVHLHGMSDQLFLAFEKHFLTSTEVKGNSSISIWTFSTAVFFSVTVPFFANLLIILANQFYIILHISPQKVVSTIGYGHPVPVTRVCPKLSSGIFQFQFRKDWPCRLHFILTSGHSTHFGSLIIQILSLISHFKGHNCRFGQIPQRTFSLALWKMASIQSCPCSFLLLN